MSTTRELRVATRIVDALANIDHPQAARLRADLTDPTNGLELRTVQEACGLLGVSATTFLQENHA